MSEIILDTKLVGSIEGTFFVPSYQRGYRWGRDEVIRLLDDVCSNGTDSYCLQPVAVRKKGDSYELIDGQQRLTTLYLIYRFMHNESGGFFDEPKFSLTYETREKSEEFLSEMDLSKKEDNIDFWFICSAYETIQEWFAQKEKRSVLTNINKYFDENVRVIWYEVGEAEDAAALFERLNIGKIPLTSAELVKAMFLSRDSGGGMSRERQEEISLQWDSIERELHSEPLWAFLTNDGAEDCQTRIDLVLNIIAQTPAGTREKYHTFFVFDELRKTKPLSDIWNQVQHTFLILKDWYENHELYHKIGYLIASRALSLQEIYSMSLGRKKSDFIKELDAQIKDSIEIGCNYAELSYERRGDYDRISRLLLLFNVESVRQLEEKTHRFPFDRYKESGAWSLEHIHAQQSEGMRKQEEWKEWLRLHIRSLAALSGQEALIGRMKECLDRPRLERREFETLCREASEALSAPGSAGYLHSISNLALLNTSDNAALNNSAFDVKRNKIIEMDMAGRYIPFCTKKVFLKYYTPSEENQLHFWGQADRAAYVRAINAVLKNYLTESISAGW